LRTQNYDKSFDQFVRNFDPESEMSATVAVVKVSHGDQGWALYCTQDSRWCLSLDTVLGLTDDEAVWIALSAWATFRPRKASQRETPGQLFCPDEYSHVFEKYWRHHTCLYNHQDFASESPYCQEHMRIFSEALAEMDVSSFGTHPPADAKPSDPTIDQDAVISPIQDGPDQWEICRSSSGTVGGGSAPDKALHEGFLLAP
jgi:hypothetical protein